jgi:hypothetical protein
MTKQVGDPHPGHPATVHVGRNRLGQGEAIRARLAAVTPGPAIADD